MARNEKPVEYAEARLVEQLDGLPRAAVLRALDNGAADIVQRARHRHAQGRGEPHGGVGVDGQDAAAGAVLRQHADDGRCQRSFPNAALAGQRQDLRLALTHQIPPWILG